MDKGKRKRERSEGSLSGSNSGKVSRKHATLVHTCTLNQQKVRKRWSFEPEKDELCEEEKEGGVESGEGEESNDSDSSTLAGEGVRPPTSEEESSRKKPKIQGLYKPPTHEELQTLKETRDLFKSNLMKLQVIITSLLLCSILGWLSIMEVQ